MIEFNVFGQPVPQGSKRVIRGNLIEVGDQRLRSWRQDVAAQASQAMDGQGRISGPVNVTLIFFLQRPKGHYGSGRNADKLRPSAPIAPGVKPDLDKLARAVLDAMTGVVFFDDAQVVGLGLTKTYADLDGLGLLVTVHEIRREDPTR